MMRNTLADVQVSVATAWKRFQALGYVLTGTMPTVKLNNRFKSTAGRIDFATREIEISTAFLNEHTEQIHNETIPHEVAHMVAWDLFEDTGHGPDWKMVMVSYGLPPDRCHNMSLSGAVSSSRQKLVFVEFKPILGQRASFIHTDRSKKQTQVVGVITKINLKTIKITTSAGTIWTVPINNTCQLRHI